MQLLIRQRVFSWTDSYDVYDESGQVRYFVKAEFFSFGHQIHVYEKETGREVGSIHQKLLALMPTFEIVINGRVQGRIRKKFALFCQDYQVDYHDWYVEGNFMGWDYRVLQAGRQVMTISKELFNWGDTYSLRYDNPAFEIPGLLLVIAIDAANCNEDQ